MIEAIHIKHTSIIWIAPVYRKLHTKYGIWKGNSYSIVLHNWRRYIRFNVCSKNILRWAKKKTLWERKTKNLRPISEWCLKIDFYSESRCAPPNCQWCYIKITNYVGKLLSWKFKKVVDTKWKSNEIKYVCMSRCEQKTIEY